MPHLSPLLTVMVQAARDAAKVLRRDYFEVEALLVRRKGAADFVSKADVAAEEAIVRSLQKSRPKYGLVLEEQGRIEGTDKSNTFIVDPLDGTTNFLHGMPQFCVSIGLERDNEMHAGVVFSPITNELFVAEKGSGAYMNDTRLRVSGREDLSEALVGCGFPWKGKAGRGGALAEADRVLSETAGIRRFGSAALDLCMVAQGRLDAFWERGLQPWDCAAGIVIVREAGGQVTTIDPDLSRKKPHQEGQVLASNHVLHEAVRGLVVGERF